MSGRKIFARPQAMLWSDNSGRYINNMWVPDGVEKQDFIILSDHNRGEISVSKQRIESRQRMINGTMRSYFSADKINITVSWEMLPSRSWNNEIVFDASTGMPTWIDTEDVEKPVLPVAYKDLNTVDGGAGGVDLLNWYENHSGPFYVYLAYDKFNNFNGYPDANSHSHLGIYNDIRLMYFASFDYNIVKRGGTNFDFWNVSVSLEEA